MKINIFTLENGITTLGPHKRYGIWVQGCHRNCDGCIAKISHDLNAGKQYDVGALSWVIATSDVEGITVSGGEPFLQAQALVELITKIKAIKDLGVIIYTGYLYEELQELPYGKELISLADMIIDGPYVKSLDDGKSLRGSSNQRVFSLTDRYKDYLHLYGSEERKAETFIHSGHINKVGIPNTNY